MKNLNRMSLDTLKILFFLESEVNKVSMSPSWEADCQHFANNYSLISAHLVDISLIIGNQIVDSDTISKIFQNHHFLLNEFKKEFYNINEREFQKWFSNQVKNQAAQQITKESKCLKHQKSY